MLDGISVIYRKAMDIKLTERERRLGLTSVASWPSRAMNAGRSSCPSLLSKRGALTKKKSEQSGSARTTTSRKDAKLWSDRDIQ